MTSIFTKFCDWLEITAFAKEKQVWAHESSAVLTREVYDAAPASFNQRQMFAGNTEDLLKPTTGIFREMPVIHQASFDDEREKMRQRARNLGLLPILPKS